MEKKNENISPAQILPKVTKTENTPTINLKDITNKHSLHKKPSQFQNPRTLNTYKSQKTEFSDHLNSFSKNTSKIRQLTKTIEKIHFHFNERNEQFTDKDFPALNKFLFSNEEELDGAMQFMKNWEWLRPEEIFPKATVYDEENQYNTEMRFGPFSCTNFVNAVATLTEKGQISKVFVDISHIEMGYAVFQFHKNGEWIYVTIDTLLPFSKELKRFLFSHNGSFEIMWFALLEKAYAKLNGNYNNIGFLSFRDILVDLSCCHLEKIRLDDPDNEGLINNKKLFSTLASYVTGGRHVLVCMNRQNKSRRAKVSEMGEFGIARNFVHAITAFEDVANKDFKFLRIKNFWGSESNWSGPFSNNSDEWEKYKSLRDDLLNSKKYFNDSTNKYFIRYENFIKEFSTVYIIKLFDESVYKTYCVRGLWHDKTNAGCPTDLDRKYPVVSRFGHKFTQTDSDDSWFNNPQYRVRVDKKTKLYISLVQHDNTSEGNPTHYTPVDFYLVKNPTGKQRVWEFPKPENVIIHANETEDEPYKPKETANLNLTQINKSQLLNSRNDFGEDKETKIKREISRTVTLRPDEEKKFGNFNIIVNLKKIRKKTAKVFFYLRIHSDNEVLIEKLPETIDKTINGSWEMKTAGGPYYPNPRNYSINPNWCLNPQYLLTFKEPTFLKIILTKTGKNAKKTKNSKLGLSYLFACINNKNVAYHERPKPLKPRKFKNKKEETKAKILEKALDHLKIPFLERLERKIRVAKEESFHESSFASTEIACLFLRVLPIEGPLLLVPSLDQSGACCDYKLTIFSNNEFDVDCVDEQRNSAVLSKWSQYNAGGSHVYNEEFNSKVEKRTWNTNPVFVLKFTDFDNFNPAEHKITVKLSICESNWKFKLMKNGGSEEGDKSEGKKQARKNKINVCSMICLYILKPSKRISINDIVYQTSFVPDSYIEYDLFYDVNNFDCKDEIYIMPATYSSGIEGKFILSAYCESPITLKAL